MNAHNIDTMALPRFVYHDALSESVSPPSEGTRLTNTPFRVDLHLAEHVVKHVGSKVGRHFISRDQVDQWNLCRSRTFALWRVGRQFGGACHADCFQRA